MYGPVPVIKGFRVQGLGLLEHRSVWPATSAAFTYQFGVIQRTLFDATLNPKPVSIVQWHQSRALDSVTIYRLAPIIRPLYHLLTNVHPHYCHTPVFDGSGAGLTRGRVGV